jgi:DNA repair protein RecO (recombination protein O)
MKKTDLGILLKRIPYSETSFVLTVFTLSEGKKSFLFQGAKKKKGNVLLPLSPIELTFFQRDDSQLAKISETTLSHTFESIPFHPVKSTIIFFKVEVLQSILHEGVKDEQLFRFIENELSWLDGQVSLTNYPIYWLLELTKYLGFFPFKPINKTPYFDLENGLFLGSAPMHTNYKNGIEIELLSDFVSLSKEELLQIDIPKKYRKNCLSILIEFYKFHIPNFNLKDSLSIIESIWE